jgi:hypothetical protein
MRTRSQAPPAVEEMVKSVETTQLIVQTPTTMEAVMDKMRQGATARGLRKPLWLTIAIATTNAIGTPKTVAAVARHIIATVPPSEVVEAIEFVREVGMSCR